MHKLGSFVWLLSSFWGSLRANADGNIAEKSWAIRCMKSATIYPVCPEESDATDLADMMFDAIANRMMNKKRCIWVASLQAVVFVTQFLRK